jgi:hypothetical protein
MALSPAESRPFDWEKRWVYDAWRVTTPEMAERFAMALCEGGLPPQYRDDHGRGPLFWTIFWWDRRLTTDEHAVAERALELAVGHLPEDAS